MQCHYVMLEAGICGQLNVVVGKIAELSGLFVLNCIFAAEFCRNVTPAAASPGVVPVGSSLPEKRGKRRLTLPFHNVIIAMQE